MKRVIRCSERARAADPKQFQMLKSRIRELTGIPSSRWENVTSVMYKQYFNPSEIAVITPVDKGFRRGSFGRGSTRDIIDVSKLSSLSDEGLFVANAKIGSSDYVVVSCPIDMFPKEEDSGEFASYWVTWAFDLRSTVYAVGVDIDREDKTSLKHLATRLGEKYFHEFSVGAGRRFSNYGALRNWLKSQLSSYAQDQIPSEEDLLEAAESGRYIKVIHD